MTDVRVHFVLPEHFEMSVRQHRNDVPSVAVYLGGDEHGANFRNSLYIDGTQAQLAEFARQFNAAVDALPTTEPGETQDIPQETAETKRPL